MAEFEQLWKHYYHRLLVYGRSFSGLSEADLEDCLQEIFFAVHRNYQRYDRRWAFSTWIYRISRNRFIDFQREARRRRSRQTVFEEEAAYARSGRGRPEVNPAEQIQRDMDLQRALGFLSNRQREALHCFYAEGMKISEISAILGGSVGTVKSLLHRGKKILAKHLEEDYG